MKALLIDLPRCTGCRGCQVACKQEHKRPAEKTKFFGGPGYQNPKDLSKDTWCLVTYSEVRVNGRFEWVFGKKQCMHCLEPGCVSACPVAALEKDADTGAVVYHKHICIGCRYCMLACPFLVPRFEYDSWNPYITKCTMCHERQQQGKIPACAQACPTGAITFGERNEMVAEAQRRIASAPSQYIHQVYGLEEAGGTCVLHLSKAPFEEVAYLTGIPHTAVAQATEPAMKAIPVVMLGLTALLGISYQWRNRTRGQGEAAQAAAAEI